MLHLGDELRLEAMALDSPLLDRLWQLYTHDLSEARRTLPSRDGLFESRHLGQYRANPGDWLAFLIGFHDRPAGFAIITEKWQFDRHTIGDFFVVRGLRRRGVGAAVAGELIGRFPGAWEIAFQDNNAGAPEFWHGVAQASVGDAWREELRPVPGKPDLPHDRWLIFDTLDR